MLLYYNISTHVRSPLFFIMGITNKMKLIAKKNTFLVMNLTLLGPMEFPIELHTMKSGWSILYIEGSQIIISKNIVFLYL